MGIKSFNVIIKKYIKDGINKIHLSDLSNKTVAIDTSIYLYRFLYDNGNYLKSFSRFINKLLLYRITPIFIFDGKPPKEKSGILNDRRKQKQILLNKLEILDVLKNDITNNTANIDETKAANTDEYNNIIERYDNFNMSELETEIHKVSKRYIHVTSEHIQKCKELFDLIGISYITASSEAEILCSYLCKQGVVYGCISEDTDILANGGIRLFRNFSLTSNYITEYNLDIILTELGLNYIEFVDLCILCGCDYTTKINGIGPINACKLILKYHTIEEIILQEIENKEKYTMPDNFNFNSARELFMVDIYSEEYLINVSTRKLLGNINITEFNTFLVENGCFDSVTSNIFCTKMNKYINSINSSEIVKKKQQSITNYFNVES
jgi:flap endonuclease-1